MKPLEIHVRGKVLKVGYSTKDKPFGSREVTILGKNKQSIYIFRKEMGTWMLAYGSLADDVREACIDAIILRFDDTVTEMFYRDGVRKVVEIRAKPKGLWHVFVNHNFAGSINKDGNKWEFYCEDGSSITEAHMGKYIAMISEGKIKRIERDGR